jgi:hypothetical protein
MFALGTFLFAAATASAPSAGCTINPCPPPPCYIGSFSGPYVPVPCWLYNPVVAPVLDVVSEARTILRNLPVKY